VAWRGDLPGLHPRIQGSYGRAEINRARRHPAAGSGDPPTTSASSHLSTAPTPRRGAEVPAAECGAPDRQRVPADGADLGGAQ
jgi:hypothetical protein